MAARENPIMVLAGIERRSNSSDELLNRLNNYGRAFQASVKTKDARLVIFASYSSKSKVVDFQKKYEYLEIYAVESESWRFLRQARLLLRLIKMQGKGPRLLIAGDPSAGFIISLIVKMISLGRHSIQVQFHGDIYKRPVVFNAKGYLRWILARIQFCFADSVRVVSRHQYDELVQISPNKSKDIFIAHIPLDPIYFSANLNRYRFSIGFIGRLHVERGIDLLKQIVCGLLVKYPDAKIIIIGDGPKKEYLMREFQDEISTGIITFLGWLTKPAILYKLEEMKILISTAPSEGYGLAIREAILSGVHVVATSSDGANSAREDFPEHVTIYSDSESAVLAIGERLEVGISTVATEIARTKQLKKDNLAVQTLVQTWS